MLRIGQLFHSGKQALERAPRYGHVSGLEHRRAVAGHVRRSGDRGDVRHIVYFEFFVDDMGRHIDMRCFCLKTLYA